MSHPHKNILVALAGQPNCGKSTIFNMLTGIHQHVANFPGVTVEKKAGGFTVDEIKVELVDLPGTYSLTSYTQEERVTRDFLLLERPEMVVVVADASNLERHLYLTFQLLEMGLPVLLCLNMMDVAERRGITIDCGGLAEELGITVIPTIATKGSGREELQKAIVRTAVEADHGAPVWRLDHGEELEQVLTSLEEKLAGKEHLMEDFSARWLAIKLLEDDREARRILLHHTHDGSGPGLLEYVQALREQIPESIDDTARHITDRRYEHAARIAGNCVSRKRVRERTRSDAVDVVVCQPVVGLAMIALCMYIVFQLTFELADGWKVVPWDGEGKTFVGVTAWFFEDVLPRLLAGMDDGPLHSMLSDGVIGGVGGVMGFVPIIFFMFLFLSIIEGSGIVARIAFILDRWLRIFGLPGHAVLPLIISGGIAGGCAVPGIMASRTLRDPRDRLVTMLVAPFMNCGAKIPVYLLLISAFFAAHQGLIMWSLTAISWMIALFAAWLLRRTVVRGGQAPLVMELPPYHLPTATSVIQSACHRSWLYLKKAGTVILAINILLWAAMYFPRGDTTAFDRDIAVAEMKLRDDAAVTPYARFFSTEELVVTGKWMKLAARTDGVAVTESDEGRLRLIRATIALQSGEALSLDDADLAKAAHAYFVFLVVTDEIEASRAQSQLRNSVAGRIGVLLESVSWLSGFDWRDNIALIGGFAAKEVIVSVLGTAYSIGEVDPPEELEDAAGNPLSRRLAGTRGWSPLRAFALMLFVMIYAPCFVTVVVIARESGSWGWAVFSIAFSTTIAFMISTTVYQVGLLFG